MPLYARPERVSVSVASCSVRHQPPHGGKGAIRAKARHSGSPGQYPNLRFEAFEARTHVPGARGWRPVKHCFIDRECASRARHVVWTCGSALLCLVGHVGASLRDCVDNAFVAQEFYCLPGGTARYAAQLLQVAFGWQGSAWREFSALDLASDDRSELLVDRGTRPRRAASRRSRRIGGPPVR